MGSKLLVIIATGVREKALAGLMYARNVLKNKLLNNIKVVFFGPFKEDSLMMVWWV